MAANFRLTEYGLMNEAWRRSLLHELCVDEGGVQTGPFGSQLHQRDYVDDGTPIITVEHIGENRIIHRDLPCVTDSDRERLKKYQLRRGDIVFSRVGAVDRRALVREDEDGWLFSGRCLRVRPRREVIDPEYLSYFLGLPGFRDYVRRIAVGATMPSLNTKLLSEVPIYYPPLRIQKAIARILGRLDDKIALNHRMNQTLEAIARALFKSWFVEFEPVRLKMENGAATLPETIQELFPNRFQDSELGSIPEGWYVSTFGAVANQIRETVDPSSLAPETPYIGLEHMPRGSIALNDWGSSRDVQSTKSVFRKGHILFGKLRPYFRKVGVAPLDGVCSTDIIVIEAAKEWFGFVLGHVTSGAFIRYTDAVSTGTRMPRVNWKAIANYKIVLPPTKVAAKFSDFVQPLAQKIILNVLQSRVLGQIRDTLLPKLIAGHLRISDAERIVGEAI